MLQNISDKTKSTIIRKSCPYCKKTAIFKSSETLGSEKAITLQCGHTYVEEIFVSPGGVEDFSVTSLSGKEPFPYQYKTLDFIEQSNFRTGIFHEQGVGKTICSLLPIVKHPAKFFPFVVVCKSSLKAQWWKEILDWTGKPAQIIGASSDKPFPEIFSCFVISYDLLRSNNPFENIPIKLVILDECQQIKNSQAKRTQGIRKLVSNVDYVFGLSGTPIKNHAGEYFPILNILHPEIFPSQTQFERDYCNSYSSGYGYKVGGLSHYGSDRFRDITKSWITRYERDDVLPDLPKIFRKNFFVELGDEVASAYKKAYIDFQEAYLEGSGDFGEQSNILAKLNRMRHLTGIAKILPVSEFVQEFLEDNDRKITLFVHHKDVGLGLYNHISKICTGAGIAPPLQLTSENAGSDIGMRIDEEWKTDKTKRVMIASTLSAGEGKNWQMCSDAVIVERQWNPANEEQAEGRFPRPGIDKAIESISITYALALGTPDEYLAEIVERKREICRKTMGNEAIAWDQSSVIREMADLLFSKGGKRWNL
jgi:SNF2 family DNA or RNA helicase